MTQKEALLDLLRQRGAHGVTPLDALTAIGSFRLAARVYDLVADGHTIRSERVRTAGGATVARYVLVTAAVRGDLQPTFDWPGL